VKSRLPNLQGVLAKLAGGRCKLEGGSANLNGKLFKLADFFCGAEIWRMGAGRCIFAPRKERCGQLAQLSVTLFLLSPADGARRCLQHLIYFIYKPY